MSVQTAPIPHVGTNGVPQTRDLSYGEALKEAATYCKDKALAEIIFVSDGGKKRTRLFNLDHPDHSKMFTTDKRIYGASGVEKIWVARN